MIARTPRTLNEWLLTQTGDMQIGFDHADAWDADNDRWRDEYNVLGRENADFRRRLRAAEKWREIAAAMAEMDPWIAKQCDYYDTLAREKKP